jgi:hypothetical protein
LARNIILLLNFSPTQFVMLIISVLSPTLSYTRKFQLGPASTISTNSKRKYVKIYLHTNLHVSEGETRDRLLLINFFFRSQMSSPRNFNSFAIIFPRINLLALSQTRTSMHVRPISVRRSCN